MIRFDEVSKRYRLGAGHASLREALTSLPRKLLGQRAAPDDESQYHWALRDVSFAVERGEALSIVGRNGAGKTTMLKLMSKITRPTFGRVKLEGRVSALIELGAGFHPDLSGRDNIYLNGAILGLSRREIDARFKSIVDFAELSTFIDTPVKRYSSGMYARLGFSVAAHTSPDILLVDEVLAVGDNNFRQKCYDFIHRFVNSGKVTVFVSHDLAAAEQLCQRSIWLERGKVVTVGNPSRVVDQYLTFLDEQAADNVEAPAEGSEQLAISQVRVSDVEGQERQVFTHGDDVVINVDYVAREPIQNPHFCIWVSDSTATEPLFAANMIIDGNTPAELTGAGTLQCVFKNVPLMPRVYYVWVEVWGADRAKLLFKWQRLASFHIMDPSLLENIDDRRGVIYFAKYHSPIKVAYEWRVPNGEARQLEAQMTHD